MPKDEQRIQARGLHYNLSMPTPLRKPRGGEELCKEMVLVKVQLASASSMQYFQAHGATQILAHKVHFGQHNKRQPMNKRIVGLSSDQWDIFVQSATISASLVAKWSSVKTPMDQPVWNFYVALENYSLAENWQESLFDPTSLAFYLQANTSALGKVKKPRAPQTGAVFFTASENAGLMASHWAKTTGKARAQYVLELQVSANIMKTCEDMGCSEHIPLIVQHKPAQ